MDDTSHPVNSGRMALRLIKPPGLGEENSYNPAIHSTPRDNSRPRLQTMALEPRPFHVRPKMMLPSHVRSSKIELTLKRHTNSSNIDHDSGSKMTYPAPISGDTDGEIECIDGLGTNPYSLRPITTSIVSVDSKDSPRPRFLANLSKVRNKGAFEEVSLKGLLKSRTVVETKDEDNSLGFKQMNTSTKDFYTPKYTADFESPHSSNFAANRPKRVQSIQQKRKKIGIKEAYNQDTSRALTLDEYRSSHQISLAGSSYPKPSILKNRNSSRGQSLNQTEGVQESSVVSKYQDTEKRSKSIKFSREVVVFSFPYEE